MPIDSLVVFLVIRLERRELVLVFLLLGYIDLLCFLLLLRFASTFLRLASALLGLVGIAKNILSTLSSSYLDSLEAVLILLNVEPQVKVMACLLLDLRSDHIVVEEWLPLVEFVEK